MELLCITCRERHVKDYVKEIKRQLITESVKAYVDAGHGAEKYREIVKVATKILNGLLREWSTLRSEDRPKATEKMFGKMIVHCRDRVQRKRNRDLER